MFYMEHEIKALKTSETLAPYSFMFLKEACSVYLSALSDTFSGEDSAEGWGENDITAVRPHYPPC